MSRMNQSGTRPPFRTSPPLPRAIPERPRTLAPAPAASPAQDEMKLFGRAACRAMFRARPEDIRKVYVTQPRAGEMRDVLAYCAKQRLSFLVVQNEDLERLTQSQHHEGVCFVVQRRLPPPFASLVQELRRHSLPTTLLLLDGISNPHNLGAILRTAAHFGVHAALLMPNSSQSLTGTACRIAEGGAERVPLLTLDNPHTMLPMLQAIGFQLVGTVVREGRNLYAAPLPARTVLMIGAEGEGLSPALISAAQVKVQIPGSGAVESLNVSAATAVLLSAHFAAYAKPLH